MSAKTSADFLSAVRKMMPSREIEIDGMTIVVRGLTRKQVKEINAYAARPGTGKKGEAPDIDDDKAAARMLSLSLYDKAGNALLSAETEGQVEDWPATLVQTLVGVINELNGWKGAESGNA